MYFHWTYQNTPLLFSGWTFDSPGAYALTLLICFAICLFSEWWSTYRHNLNSKKNEETTRLINNSSNNGSNKFKELYDKFFTSHLWKTIVHMIAFIISYTIMLIFMSYNGGIAIACVLGVGLGYYLFARERHSVAIVEDLCH